MPYFENRGALVAEELRFDIGFGRSSLDLEMVRFGSKYLLELKKFAFSPCSSVPVQSRAVFPFNCCHRLRTSVRTIVYR